VALTVVSLYLLTHDLNRLGDGTFNQLFLFIQNDFDNQFPTPHSEKPPFFDKEERLPFAFHC
jgi:hypothetical protein